MTAKSLVVNEASKAQAVRQAKAVKKNADDAKQKAKTPATEAKLADQEARNVRKAPNLDAAKTAVIEATKHARAAAKAFGEVKSAAAASKSALENMPSDTDADTLKEPKKDAAEAKQAVKD